MRLGDVIGGFRVSGGLSSAEIAAAAETAAGPTAATKAAGVVDDVTSEDYEMTITFARPGEEPRDVRVTRGTLLQLLDQGRLRRLEDGTFTTPEEPAAAAPAPAAEEPRVDAAPVEVAYFVALLEAALQSAAEEATASTGEEEAAVEAAFLEAEAAAAKAAEEAATAAKAAAEAAAAAKAAEEAFIEAEAEAAARVEAEAAKAAEAAARVEAKAAAAKAAGEAAAAAKAAEEAARVERLEAAAAKAAEEEAARVEAEAAKAAEEEAARVRAEALAAAEAAAEAEAAADAAAEAAAAAEFEAAIDEDYIDLDEIPEEPAFATPLEEIRAFEPVPASPVDAQTVQRRVPEMFADGYGDTLVARFARKFGAEVAEAENVRRAYEQFLVIKAVGGDFDGTFYSPPPLVDEMWLLHVMDTAHYGRQCERAFGRVVHRPGRCIDDPDGTADPATRFRRIGATHLALTYRFGAKFDQRIWHWHK